MKTVNNSCSANNITIWTHREMK